MHMHMHMHMHMPMRVHMGMHMQVYDKSEDGRPRFVFHTAFDDPSSPADAPPLRARACCRDCSV